MRLRQMTSRICSGTTSLRITVRQPKYRLMVAQLRPPMWNMGIMARLTDRPGSKSQ